MVVITQGTISPSGISTRKLRKAEEWLEWSGAQRVNDRDYRLFWLRPDNKSFRYLAKTNENFDIDECLRGHYLRRVNGDDDPWFWPCSDRRERKERNRALINLGHEPGSLPLSFL